MTPTEILKDAKARVEAGWIQYDYKTDVGCCAAGAIHLAAGSPDGYGPWADDQWYFQATVAKDILREITGHNIGAWNDATDRTKDEVLAAFDKAIELSEKK